MNPIRTHTKMYKVHGISCSEINCKDAGHCQYIKSNGVMCNTRPSNGACQYEWQCTLNYPGRYD